MNYFAFDLKMLHLVNLCFGHRIDLHLQAIDHQAFAIAGSIDCLIIAGVAWLSLYSD
jgi:hypothetical protein